MSDITPSEAGSRLRAIPTPARARASRENGRKGGRPFKPLEEIACTCRSRTPEHKSWCAKMQAAQRRAARNK